MTTTTTALATLFEQAPIRTAGQPEPWIIDRLIRTGAITETGLSRRARPRPCPTCKTWTITGLDADVMAFEATCDPAPLTPLGEVAALMAGRRTLGLVQRSGRYELEQRWAEHIDADRHRLDVLASHTCGQPITGEALVQSSAFKPASSSTLPPNSPAPF